MMRQTMISLLALACWGCGSEAPETPAPVAPPTAAPKPASTGSAPQITSLELSPAVPVSGDRVSLKYDASDPDGDALDVTIDWYVNRARYAMNGQSELDTAELPLGAEIYAVVTVSDGQQNALRQTAAVRISNAPPRVTTLSILPKRPSSSEALIAEASVYDHEGDEYTLEFEWFRNDEVIAGEHGATLQPGKVRKGDRVYVRATARDASRGPASESEPVEIKNAAPQITSEPSSAAATGNLYRYQLKAEDPDGDRPLRYTLIEGPDGMSVDLVSGLVEWTVAQDASGKIPIEVSVRDPYGAEARQRYDLEFSWEAVRTRSASDGEEDSPAAADVEDEAPEASEDDED